MTPGPSGSARRSGPARARAPRAARSGLADLQPVAQRHPEAAQQAGLDRRAPGPVSRAQGLVQGIARRQHGLAVERDRGRRRARSSTSLRRRVRRLAAGHGPHSDMRESSPLGLQPGQLLGAWPRGGSGAGPGRRPAGSGRRAQARRAWPRRPSPRRRSRRRPGQAGQEDAEPGQAAAQLAPGQAQDSRQAAKPPPACCRSACHPSLRRAAARRLGDGQAGVDDQAVRIRTRRRSARPGSGHE